MGDRGIYRTTICSLYNNAWHVDKSLKYWLRNLSTMLMTIWLRYFKIFIIDGIIVESHLLTPVFTQRQHECNLSIRYCCQNRREGVLAKNKVLVIGQNSYHSDDNVLLIIASPYQIFFLSVFYQYQHCWLGTFFYLPSNTWPVLLLTLSSTLFIERKPKK